MSEPQPRSQEDFLKDAHEAQAAAVNDRRFSRYAATASGVVGGLGAIALFEGGLMTVDGAIGIGFAVGLGKLAHALSDDAVTKQDLVHFYKNMASDSSQEP